MCTVVIGDSEKDHLIITVNGRAHPDSTDYWDGNWLLCEIHMVSGAFTGDISHDVHLRVDEFKSFFEEVDDLYKSLKGTAKYSSLEQWIQLEISGDGRGHMLAKGCVIDKHIEGNKLNFSIHFDQTALPKTLIGLRDLLSQYPLIGQPN